MSYNGQETSVYSGAPVELYRFTRGATEYLYTSADGVQTADGRTYQPETIRRTQIDQSQEDLGGSIDVTMPRTNEVAGLFIAYLPTEPVALTIYRFHRGDSQVVTAFIGKVASAAFTVNGEAVLRCVPMSEALRRTIPPLTFAPTCGRALYDDGCGKNPGAFRVDGTLTSVSGDSIRAAAWNTKPDGWFNNGFIEAPNGATRYIIRHAGDLLVLSAPLLELQVGDVVGAYAGCDRKSSTCDTKFSNLVNFLGWEHIPKRNFFDKGL